MTGLIGFLIFILLVALVCVIVDYVVGLVLGMIGAPGNVRLIARAIIMLLALLIIVNKALPFIGAYT